MKHICSWSGGKDSTAGVILAHEHNVPIDYILFSEVMFDREKNISGENIKHIDFVYNKARPVFEAWGYQVEILRSERDYLDIFHRKMKRATVHPEHIGKKYGFCISGLCSIKRDCKLKPIKDFYKSLNEEIVEYIGICADESTRLQSLKSANNKISILDRYGYTQQMARSLCEQYDLLSPSYELTKRNGCWFCPNAKLCEHRELRKYDPETWYRFIALENEKDLAQDKWNAITKETLYSREILLSREC